MSSYFSVHFFSFVCINIIFRVCHNSVLNRAEILSGNIYSIDMTFSFLCLILHFKISLCYRNIGSKTFQQHRQVMGEDHDKGSRDTKRGAVLCW